MRVTGWVAVATAMLGMSAAHAVSYDRLYVFGDSLVDSGNAAIASPGSAPASGRFSNGYNFADDLSAALGFGPATAFLAGGTNYAVGGATATTTGPVPVFPPVPGSSLVPPSLGQQIANFYEPSVASGVRPAIDPNSLVLVTIGGNDVRAILEGKPITIGGAAAAVQSGLSELIADGARNIVVVGLPDIGKIPSVLAAGSAASVAGTQLSLALNSTYAQIVGGLSASLGSAGSIELFDLFGLQHQIIANPTAFGVDPALLTTGCVEGGGLATNCAGYTFYDGIHPTAQIHTFIAQGIAAQIPEPQSWALMILGFGLTGAALRRRWTQAAAE